MAKYVLSFGFFFSSIQCELFAQQTPIQTDRPDQTECPFIVPARYLQVENGFLAEWKGGKQTGFTSPSTLWKYGVNDNWELRLLTEFVFTKENGKTTMGLMPVAIGFKSNLCREKGIMPTISFIGHLTTRNAGSKKYATTYAAPSFRFTMAHTLSDQMTLGYNIGSEWDGESATPSYLYTVTTCISMGKKLGCYAEVFGFVRKGTVPEHNIDGGFTYLVTPDLQLDMSGGTSIAGMEPAAYVSIGLSYRFRLAR